MKGRKKLLVSFISVLCFGLLAPSITSCDNGTVGLEFSLLEDGSAYSVKASKFSFQTKMSIPETYKGKPVTVIEKLAFHQINKKVTKLKEIEIPSSITTIGENAFNGSGLTSVTIPDSVTSIGDSAFWGCSSLTNISLGNGLNSISYGTFAACTSLESITIPDGVTSISEEAFYGCSSLTSIVIPDSVTSIYQEAFSECSSLTTVYYTGTEEQWNSISIQLSNYSGGDTNEELTNANIIYNYEG